MANKNESRIFDVGVCVQNDRCCFIFSSRVKEDVKSQKFEIKNIMNQSRTLGRSMNLLITIDDKSG